MKIKISVIIENVTNDYIINNKVTIKEALKTIYNYENKITNNNFKYVYSFNTKMLVSTNFTFEEANIQNGDKIVLHGEVYE